jgi:hypothetical protein
VFLLKSFYKTGGFPKLVSGRFFKRPFFYFSVIFVRRIDYFYKIFYDVVALNEIKNREFLNALFTVNAFIFNPCFVAGGQY